MFKKHKILIFLVIVTVILFIFSIEKVRSQTVCYGVDGCTGIGSATAGDVGKFLKVSDDSPFTYIFDSVSSAVGYQEPTGDVNGINKTFVFTTAPNVISADGSVFRKLESNGVANWSGTTTISLNFIAPNYDIYGIN